MPEGLELFEKCFALGEVGGNKGYPGVVPVLVVA